MNPIAISRLRDALESCRLIIEWTEGLTYEDYLADRWHRAAIERHVEIIGEALNQASRADPVVIELVPDLTGWIAMRNIVSHAYHRVEHRLVWDTCVLEVPTFSMELERVLREQNF